MFLLALFMVFISSDFEIVISTILDILSSEVMKRSIYFEYTLQKGELFFLF